MDRATQPERRSTDDRRGKPRGGRRPYDVAGLAPLVLVVGDAEARDAGCGAILARLHFAVTPAANTSDALRAIAAVRPDLIVAAPDAANRLHREAAVSIPVVEFDAAREDSDALVQRIRKAIRRV